MATKTVCYKIEPRFVPGSGTVVLIGDPVAGKGRIIDEIRIFDEGGVLVKHNTPRDLDWMMVEVEDRQFLKIKRIADFTLKAFVLQESRNGTELYLYLHRDLVELSDPSYAMPHAGCVTVTYTASSLGLDFHDYVPLPLALEELVAKMEFQTAAVAASRCEDEGTYQKAHAQMQAAWRKYMAAKTANESYTVDDYIRDITSAT